MSRSDTDADIIDTSRPRYPLGGEVSFVYRNQVHLGIVASSRQVVLARNGGIRISYDIHSSSTGMIFSNIAEESILQMSRLPNHRTQAGR